MLRYKTASPMMSTAVIGLMKEKHMNRFWQREEFSGKIEQAEIYFDYTDDEWGNSGTLHIQFLSDSILIRMWLI